MKAFLVAESIHQTLRLPLTGWPGRVRTAPLCRAKGPDSQQPPRAVQAGGTWPLPVSQSSWRGVDSGCGPARSSLCISRRRPRRAQRPPVLAPWRRARAARVLARSSRRQGFPARTHCPVLPLLIQRTRFIPNQFLLYHQILFQPLQTTSLLI